MPSTPALAHCPRFVVAACLLGLAALPAQASPVLTFHDALGEVDSLRLGDDLWVTAQGLEAGASYQLRLLDAQGITVATRDTTADEQGTFAKTLLWQRSGVVGCDPGSRPDPRAWRFRRFEEAEARHGQRLQITLARQPGGEVARRELPLRADTKIPRYYLSDEDACPRFHLIAGANLWLSGLHLEKYAGQERWLWVLDPQQPLTAEVRDLRRSYPAGQQITVPIVWQGKALTQVADPPFLFFWVSVEPPPPDPKPGIPDGPGCLTYPVGPPLPSGTQTTPNPACPPCIDP